MFASTSSGRVITVFRNRLREDCAVDEYDDLLQELSEIVARIPGFRGSTQYTSESGERLSIVEFDSRESQQEWARHPAHIKAQLRGREAFYAWFHIQICEEARAHRWAHASGLQDESDSTVGL